MNTKKRLFSPLILAVTVIISLTACVAPDPEPANQSPAALSQGELEMMIENLIEEGVLIKTYHMGPEAHMVVGDVFYFAEPNVQKNYAKLVLDYWKTYVPTTQWVFLEDGKAEESIGSYSTSWGLTLELPRSVRNRLQ